MVTYMGNIIEKNNTLLERALVYKDQDAFVKLFNCNEHIIHSYIKEGLGLKNDNIHKDIYKEYYSVGKFSLIKAINSSLVFPFSTKPISVASLAKESFAYLP